MKGREIPPAAVLALVALAWLYLREQEAPPAPTPAAPAPKPKAQGGTLMTAKQAFVAQLLPIAMTVEREPARIRAALGVTQAAHESSWGRSELASPASRLQILPAGKVGPANNLFGITAEIGTYWRTQNRPYVLMPTTEWKLNKATGKKDPYKTTRPFRAYASLEESYRDWARLMQTEAYVKVGALDALRRGDLAAFAEAMKRIGYATDPDYAVRINDTGHEVLQLV